MSFRNLLNSVLSYIKTKRKNIFIKLWLVTESLGQSLAWTLGSMFFGLVPLGIIYLVWAIDLEKQKELSSTDINHKIIVDGIIMFLCTALIGSVTIDVLFTKKTFSPKFIGFTIAMSLITLGFVTAVYVFIFNKPEKILDFRTLNSIQIILIYITLGFCILCKLLLFYKHKKS